MAVVLAVKRLAGITPEVNLGNPLCVGKKACKQGIYPGFKTQSICHHKSEIGVSGVLQKELCPPKNLIKTNFVYSNNIKGIS